MYHGSRAGAPGAVNRTELQRLIGNNLALQYMNTWTHLCPPRSSMRSKFLRAKPGHQSRSGRSNQPKEGELVPSS
jgi:hypothetical protein